MRLRERRWTPHNKRVYLFGLLLPFLFGLIRDERFLRREEKRREEKRREEKRKRREEKRREEKRREEKRREEKRREEKRRERRERREKRPVDQNRRERFNVYIKKIR